MIITSLMGLLLMMILKVAVRITACEDTDVDDPDT